MLQLFPATGPYGLWSGGKKMLKSIRHAAENPTTVCKLVTSSAESILKSQFALTKYEISVLEGHGFRHILPECDEKKSI